MQLLLLNGTADGAAVQLKVHLQKVVVAAVLQTKQEQTVNAQSSHDLVISTTDSTVRVAWKLNTSLLDGGR